MGDTAPLEFFQACKDGDLDTVREALAGPEFDPNAVDDAGLAGLHYAAQAGHWAVVEALRASPGINVNLANGEGNTAWHLACQSTQGNAEDRINVLRCLANPGPKINVNARNNAGETGFLLAVKANDCAVVDALLNGNISDYLDYNAVEYVDVKKQKDNSFTAACRLGHTNLVMDLLLSKSISVDFEHIHGIERRNGLMIAVVGRHHNLVRELLIANDNGRLDKLDVNEKDGIYENTAFHFACRLDDTEMVKVFLQYLGRVDPRLRNDSGRTAMELCPSESNRDLIAQKILYWEGQQRNLRRGSESFKIDRQSSLGKGGFGEVFRGCFEKKPAAIKVPTVAIPTISDLRAFQKEVAVWASLGDHDNVLPLLGFCEEPMMLACPVAVSDMWNYLDDRKNSPDYCKIAIRILRGVALGLDHVQRTCQVVHGDLKPVNVLIFEDKDGRPVPKVADFGTSKIRPNDHTVLSSSWAGDTGAGTAKITGSLGFAAPEVTQAMYHGTGGQKFSKRFKSDVWSFGMMVYYAAFLKAPYFSNVDYEFDVSAIIRAELPRRLEGCPDWLWGLVEFCARPDPAERPSFEEIVSEIDRIIKENGL